MPDNLKSGIHSANRYEPSINDSYAELAAFYEVAVIPARVKKPRDKPKVENAVQQVERWALAPLRDRTFFSLDELNEELAQRVAAINDRFMKGPKASRRQLFLEEDRPAMRCLPASGYAFATWKRAKVGPDYHVEVEGHLYSVPYTLVGKQVDVRMSVGTVEVFEKSRRVASHLRSLGRRGFTTDPSHMPERHRNYAQWTPERMVRWALTVGPNASAFVAGVLEKKLHPEQGFRTCMGTLDARTARSIDRGTLDALASCRWLKEKRNVVLVGPTGVGKTFVSSALALRACEQGFSARYFRAPRLLHDLDIARADGTYKNKLASLARIDLIIFDDWLIAPLQDAHRRDLLEILDDRYDNRSTLVASQLPVELWHEAIGDPTLADAILDRLVHNAYRLDVKGDSLRKARALDNGKLDPTPNPKEETTSA